MFTEIYGWLEAGSVFLIYGLAIIIAWIKVNDLPHINERLARLEGSRQKRRK